MRTPRILHLIVVLLTSALLTHAQVGINSTSSSPDPSSMLDVSSTNKGVLIPRMTLAQRNTITNPANGLMIFQTDNTPGFYYNYGTASAPSWTMIGAGTSDWSLTGNSAIDSTTNFIGTTDNKPLIFRINNVPHLRLSPGGHIEPLNTIGSVYLGEMAGKSGVEDASDNVFVGYMAGSSNIHGSANTAIGNSSLFSLQDVNANTALGAYSLYHNLSGSNTAVGIWSLYSNIDGWSNTATGSGALYYNTYGYNNTADGESALFNNITGCDNTAIGYSSGVSSGNLSNTTAIGSNAIATASNQVRLGDNNITSLFCKGAFATTSDNPSNLFVDENGQIMRSTGCDADSILKVMLLTEAQRDSIPDPTIGMLIYNLDDANLNFYNGTEWVGLAGSNNNVPPAAPVAGVHVATNNSILWNWNLVPGVSGYKWNTSDDYITAIDLGLCNSKIESGLPCNLDCFRYFWAYNCAGNSPATIFTQSTTISFPLSPTEETHETALNQITWRWNSVVGATGYKWNDTESYFTAIDIGNNLSRIETGLTCGTAYTRYVWAYNSCGMSDVTYLTQSTTSNPATTEEGVDEVYSMRIIWHWSPANGAIGYKWGSSNNYETAEDMGTSISKTETGLTPGTAYTRYVWAYTTCGNSSSVTLSATTNTQFTCGEPFSVGHVAGNVAPVSKTVTYSTVNNIPGEPTKCWIAQNLGADHQAYSVNDPTEASAGWYWQFNRMQGYKHDGSTRTPNTEWIDYINENSDWMEANDPCAIELGAGWRLPTGQEYDNIYIYGSWTDWNGPWNSALKMHASGTLGWYDGSLYDRGFEGDYWSSSQTIFVNFKGRYLTFIINNYCIMNSEDKSVGNAIRCLRD